MGEGTQRLRRGKVFYRFLFSYFLILLIPLFLSFMVFRQSHRLLEQEAERANSLILNHLKEYCDKIMNDVLSITSLVSNNSRLEGLIYSKDRDNPDLVQLANRNVLSFYVYLSTPDLIISPSGYYSSESFYRNMLSGIDLSYEEWLSHLSPIKRRYFSPFMTVDNSEHVYRTMAAFTPLPVTETTGSARAVCVAEIDLALFRDLMGETVWTEKSALAIYDRDRGILLSTGEDFPSAELLGRIDPLALPPGHMERLLIGDRPYAALFNRSDVLPWSYISLVPEDIYNDRFNRLYRIDLLFLLLSALIGSVFIYFTSKSRYRPILDLLALIQPPEEKGPVVFSGDEFSLITRGIAMTMEEDSRLRREMTENLPILQQRELRRLLKGEVPNDGETEKRLEKLGLSFDKAYFLLILLDIEPEEDAPADLRDLCIDMLSHTEGGQAGFWHPIKDMDGYVAYLVNRSRNSYYEILEDMARIRGDIEETHSVNVAMGLSLLHPREDGFSQLYREARRALEFRLVKGRTRPILYEDICKAIHTYYYPLEEEKKLMAAIRSGSDQDAFEILDGIFKANFDGDSLMSVEMARCLMNDLIATLIKGLDRFLAGEEDSFWHDLKPLGKLTACKSFEVLKTEMEELLYQVCSHIKRGQKTHNDRLRENILAYVEEHYTEPGLCAEGIADHFERNPAYLARFFKEQTSLGLAAHIKHYRVSRSLELLADDRKTVGAIAEEVGFMNANAYIRAFKESEGMTPGQYRENLPNR